MRRHVVIEDLATHPKKFVSLLQLAEYLGIARRTIYYHVEKGALRVIKRGGVLRVTIEEARQYAGIPSTEAPRKYTTPVQTAQLHH